MDLGVAMRPDILADTLMEGRVGRRAIATWNTRRLPTRLTPGWTNRLFVACQGWWRGAFPLSGDVLWNPADEAAPYTLIFDPQRWSVITPVRAPAFRGWRYLASAPGGAADRRDVPGAGADPPPGPA
jgi:hypothetical protein